MSKAKAKREKVGYLVKVKNPNYAKNPGREAKWLELRLFHTRHLAIQAIQKAYSWAKLEDIRVEGVRTVATWIEERKSK